MKAKKKLLLLAFALATIFTVFAAFAITSSAAETVEMQIYPSGYGSDFTYGEYELPEKAGVCYTKKDDLVVTGTDENGLASYFLDALCADVTEDGNTFSLIFFITPDEGVEDNGVGYYSVEMKIPYVSSTATGVHYSGDYVIRFTNWEKCNKVDSDGCIWATADVVISNRDETQVIKEDTFTYKFKSLSGFNVNPKTLTFTDVSVSAADKTYDGKTAATVTSTQTINGLVDGDKVGVSLTGAFADANVGNGKTVTITDAVLTGADAVNYTFDKTAFTNLSATADITATTVTVNGYTVTDSKYYDGNTSAAVDISNATVEGVEGVTVIGCTAEYNSANVADANKITVTFTLSNPNYVVEPVELDATINPVTITISDVAALDKIYDGKTAAEITYTFDGVIGIEDVTVVYTADFDDKNAAENKNVSVYFALEGADIGNYVLDMTATTLSATITPVELTLGKVMVTAADKVYDGTTDATLDAPEINKGLIEGDVLKSRWIGTFADKNVGTDIAVTVKLVLEGENSMNYVIVDIPEDGILTDANLANAVTADITKKTLTIKYPNIEFTYGISVYEYMIDNGDEIEAQTQIVGLVGGDKLETTISDGTVSDISIKDTIDVGKYTLVFTNDNYDIIVFGGEITVNRAAVEGTLALDSDWEQVIYGDALPEGWENLVTGLPEIPYGLTLTTDYTVGDNVGDYTISVVVSDEIAHNYDVLIESVTFSVAKRALTITANDVTVEYGDEPVFSVRYDGLADCDRNADGTLNTDREHITVNEKFITAYNTTNNAGKTQLIIIKSYGFDSVNYDVTKVNGTLTVKKKVIDITVGKLNVVYGNTLDLSNLTFNVSDEFVGDDTFESAFGVSLENLYLNNVETDYVEGTPVGADVAINLVDLVATNYELNITYEGVEISKRDVELTVNSFDVAYGNTPNADGSYSLNAEQIFGSDVINVTFSYVNASDVAYLAGTAKAGETFTVGATIDNNNYNLVYTAPATLTVTKKAVTVTVADNTINYGDALNATVTVDGFFGTQGVTYTLGGYTAGDDKGTYTITIDKTTIVANEGTDLNNYEITVVDGTLTVNAKQITLTANNNSVTYGENGKANGFTLSYKFGEDTVIDPANVIYTFITADGTNTPYVAGNAVGTYYIVPSIVDTTAVDSNYEIIALVEGELTVNKKAITVTANNGSITYGDALPETPFGVTVDPALFGEDTLEITYEYGYVPGENNVGNYDITIEIAETDISKNYDITVIGGTLEVKKHIIKVTVDLDTPTINYGTKFNGIGTVTVDEKYADLIEQTESNTVATAPNYDTTDATKRGVGSYDITITTIKLLDTTNYVLEYVGDKTLTVAPLDITVTPDSKTVTYGDNAPDYTWEECKALIPYTEDIELFNANIGFNSDYVKAVTVSGNYDIVAEFINDYINANYNVTFAPGTLTVEKKAVTFTVPSAEIYYGNAEPDYVPTIVWNGLVGEDTLENSFVGSVVIDALDYSVGSNATVYEVTVSNNLNSDKYVATYEGKTSLTVIARPVTVTLAEAYEMVYGTTVLPDFAVTVGGEGFAPAHSLADIGTFEFSTTYTVGNGIGNYDVYIIFTANENNKDNYSVEVINGQFEVTQATLYITPADVFKLKGEAADPEIKYTYSGLVFDDTVTFTGALSRISGEEIGYYDITLGTLQVLNGNYKLELDTTVKFCISGLTISNKTLTLGFRDEIFMNYYFKINYTGDVGVFKDGEAYGILQWTEEQYLGLGGNYKVEGNEAYILPAYFDATGNGYNLKANGQAIAAPLYTDTYYTRAFVRLEDGSYIYGNIIAYSVKDYAEVILNDGITYEHESLRNPTKALVIGLLDYGSSAQIYFGTATAVEELANSIVTQDMRDACGIKEFADLTMPENDDSLKTVEGVEFDSSLLWNRGSATFDGAFKLNFYGSAPDGDYTSENFGIIYWTEDMIEDGKFIPENGVTVMLGETVDGKKITFKNASTGYVLSVDELAAAEGTVRYYVAMARFDAEGKLEACSRVTFLSIEDYAYAVTKTYNDVNVKLGETVLVYLDAARSYKQAYAEAYGEEWK